MATDSLDFKSGLDDSKFQAGINRMDKAASKLGASMAKAFAGGAVIGGLAAIGTILKNVTNEAIEFGSTIKDNADRLSMSTTAMQGLTEAFGLSGARSEDVQKGMTRLNISLDDARNNTGTAREAFEKLGIAWEQIDNESPEEVLYIIAEAVKNAKDPVAALTGVMDILGKTGAKMVPGLTDGADALRKMADEAGKISDADIKLLDDYGDAIQKLNTKFSVLKATVVVGTVEALKKATPKQALKKGVELATLSSMPLVGPFLATLKAGMDLKESAKERASGEQFGPSMAEMMATPKSDPKIGEQSKKEANALADRNSEQRALEAQSVKDKEKFNDDRRAENEAYAKYEYDTQREANEHFEAEEKEKHKKLKQQQDAAAREQAGNAMKNAQDAAQKAVEGEGAARDSLRDVLSGKKPKKLTSKERQVERLMENAEKGVGGKSSRSGANKALKEFKEAQEKRKAAEELQKKAVEALELIEKGINGG